MHSPSNIQSNRRRNRRSSDNTNNMRRRRRRIPTVSYATKTLSLLLLVFIPQIIPTSNNYLPQIPTVHASGLITNLVSSTYEYLFPPEDYIDEDFETKTLNIVEISDMRARDIKRRLGRKHGYDPDELSRMIDKKDLINTLSFEEHKNYMRESERIKWIRFVVFLLWCTT